MNVWFHGRRVSLRLGYPVVYWPDHPCSSESDGMAYVHRIVAYEEYGDEVFGSHVHHKDEDKENYSPENLVLMSPSEHSSHHADRDKRGIVCAFCWSEDSLNQARFDEDGDHFCSLSCSSNNRQRNDWPAPRDLMLMVEEDGFSAVGRRIGVSGNAVRKKLKKNGLM